MCVSVKARLKSNYHDIVKNEDLTPLFCSGSTRVDWNEFFVLRLWVDEKLTSGKSRQDFGV